MAAIRTENINTSINELNEDFAGRKTMANYDESKQIHIHRRNRAFVWSKKMQEKLLDSILKGYYIPPIICCSNKGGERRYVMEGGNRITSIRKILNGEVRELTADEDRRVRLYQITIVVMRNLTNKQQREMFRRLNKNIKVSDGQLYAMSEEDSPLIMEALAMLTDIAYPDRARISNVFSDGISKDTDSKSNLSNAVAIISGIINGVRLITKSFERQEQYVECQEPIDREKITRVMDIILTIFESADTEFPIIKNVNNVKKAQFTVGKYFGAIMYDILMETNEVDEIIAKWKTYIVMVRSNVENACDAIVIPGAENINPDKLKKKCHKVERFVRDRVLASAEEIAAIKHVYENDQACEEDNEESDIEQKEDGSDEN